MADTCIVCLGDLCAPDPKPPPIKDELDKLDDVDVVPSVKLASKAPIDHNDLPPEVGEDDFIAHILPCGHNLHDSCLRPWVERANSCPICRATFNMVELRQSLHGPTISSYAVQDKIQTAEVEPPSLTDGVDDDVDIESIPPCMVCESFGDESLLLLCDSCNQSCHVFCAGLDGIPTGSWFCYDCQSDPQVWVQPRNRAARRATSQRQRASRRQAGPASENLTAWARLWRSVATRTSIDLDFPFSDGESEDRAQINDSREFRSWQRRFQVAARAAGPGAANRFREIAPVAHQTNNPESQEELKAWNAYEKARIILEDSDSRTSKKRKSRSATPIEDRPTEPERKRKRPRTLIKVPESDTAIDVQEPIVAESSRTPARNASIAAPRPSSERLDSIGGPTFLQSLLQEVEANPLAEDKPELFFDVNGEYFPYGSERSASPEASLPNSGQATPRAMTPPPLRPTSPIVPTSHVAPIFPPAPEFPVNATVPDSVERARSRQRAHLAARSPESSPTRPAENGFISSPSSSNPPTPQATSVNHQLGLLAKKEVQSLVKQVLKIPYREKKITAEEYTTINKSICYHLYGEIGTEENLASDKDKWQQLAKQQVKDALAQVKTEANVKPEPAIKAEPSTESGLPIRQVS